MMKEQGDLGPRDRQRKRTRMKLLADFKAKEMRLVFSRFTGTAGEGEKANLSLLSWQPSPDLTSLRWARMNGGRVWNAHSLACYAPSPLLYFISPHCTASIRLIQPTTCTLARLMNTRQSLTDQPKRKQHLVACQHRHMS